MREAKLTYDEMIEELLKRSEASYEASLRLGRKLLLAILLNAMRPSQQKTDKEVTKGYAKRVAGPGGALSDRLGPTVREVTTWGEGMFTNEVDIFGQKIVAKVNNNKLNPKAGNDPLPNSEVFWWQYKKALRAAIDEEKGHREQKGVAFDAETAYREQKRVSLAQIVRHQIANDTTLDTMRWCQGTSIEGTSGWFVVHPAEPELDDFCALLGTPNGTAAGWLLIQHGKSFTKKEIDRIEYSLRSREMQIHYS